MAIAQFGKHHPFPKQNIWESQTPFLKHIRSANVLIYACSIALPDIFNVVLQETNKLIEIVCMMNLMTLNQNKLSSKVQRFMTSAQCPFESGSFLTCSLRT